MKNGGGLEIYKRQNGINERNKCGKEGDSKSTRDKIGHIKLTGVERRGIRNLQETK